VLRETALQCTYAAGIGGPPQCEGEAPETTITEVFLFTQCERGWSKIDLAAIAQELST
jgi:hypothetical protein